MVTVMREDGWQQHLNFWEDIQSGELPPTPENFKDMLEDGGFVAAVDFPTANYYKALMEAYPEAKVVLTVRDPDR